MRTSVLHTAALLLMSSLAAAAQQPPAAPPTAGQQPPGSAAAQTPAASSEWRGALDFGYRGTSTTGDAARYQRYRDLTDRGVAKATVQKKTDRVIFDASVLDLGRHDQRYFAYYNGGKAVVFGLFNSNPLNYSYLTSTPWAEQSPNVFTLDPLARQAVQNKAPGIVGVPMTPVDLQTPSIYRILAHPFDLTSYRDSASLGATLYGSKDFDVNLGMTTTKRSGHQPWGASFAFNVADELPMRVDNRTNDFSASAEWARDKGVVRLAWDGSWFDNKLKELVWDNPYRATDTTPYDPNGYSNGNGPARGRMSVAPGNSMNAFSATGLYKLRRASTVNGQLSFTTMRQNDTLIPWTINGAIANPAVYASFPGLAALPRDTAEAKVNGINALVNFNTRVSPRLGLTARYRYNNHDNMTPVFDAREYVRFDAVPEETGQETEQFDIREHTLDVNATYGLMPFTTLRVGYGLDAFNRTGRFFNDTTDNTFRTSIDTLGNQFVTVRALYEYSRRRGSGFSEDRLEEGGSQPGLRFYDEADRNRHRATLLLSLNPVDMVDLTFSLAAGRDTYQGPGHEFGLLDNDNTGVTVGIDVTPTDAIAFGASYGRDHYKSDQMSRNANPPPDPSFTDPLRNWSLKNTENVNNFDLYLDLPTVIRKTNARVAYDYSDSDNDFTFGGPRVASLAAVGQFLPLPAVTNRWNRLSADAEYMFARQVGVGFTWWYEKFDVTDFATIDVPGQPGTPRIDYLGEINTGYGNRPYTGNTGFVRLLVHF